MPKLIVPLKETECRNTKTHALPYKLYDGQGLYLEVLASDRKYWRMKYRYLGRENRISLGSYPEISLAEARELKSKIRKQVLEHKDPAQVKRDERQALMDERHNTLEKLAREWHKKNSKIWTERHAKYVMRRLETDIFPYVGDRPLTQLKPKELVEVLHKIEDRKAHDLPRRMKQTLEQIFRHGIANNRMVHNPMSGFLSKDIFEPYKKGHYAALDARELPSFLATLEKNEARLYPLTRLAVKLLMLTFVRTNELIESEWHEFNFEEREWRIPAHRMKMRKEHIVPLSNQALEILSELQKYRIHRRHTEFPDYVFPNQVNGRKAMSNNTILKAIERLGYKGKTTGHGFRAMAMTCIKEKLNYRHEVVDRQLAHAPRNNVDKAYDRADFLADRKVMMQEWGDYLATQATKGVIVQGNFDKEAA